MRKLLTVFILFTILWGGELNAQGNDLTEGEKEAIIERIVDKLDAFQDDLSILVDKDYSPATKKERIKSTLELFIGKGDPYMIQVPDDYYNWVDKRMPAVTMGIITSKYKGQRIKKPMKSYLNGLVTQAQSSRIKMEQADAVRVDNIRQINDNQYIATATILQHFVKYYGDGRKYEDYTTKRVKVYISKTVQHTLGEDIVQFQILLGDIDATEIY